MVPSQTAKYGGAGPEETVGLETVPKQNVGGGVGCLKKRPLFGRELTSEKQDGHFNAWEEGEKGCLKKKVN